MRWDAPRDGDRALIDSVTHETAEHPAEGAAWERVDDDAAVRRNAVLE
jgi:hypothetical protein